MYVSDLNQCMYPTQPSQRHSYVKGDGGPYHTVQIKDNSLPGHGAARVNRQDNYSGEIAGGCWWVVGVLSPQQLITRTSENTYRSYI